MKGQFWRNPHLWMLLLPALLWWVEVSSRVYLIEPYCVKTPDRCDVEKIPSWDRFLIGMEDPRADHYSFVTQNASGALALSVSVAWNLAVATSPTAKLANIGRDLLIILQTALWNGAATEGVRVLVQRPRPFVYSDPVRGSMAANYVSFYSGHTSGAAAAMMALFLILYRRGASRALLFLAGSAGFSLVFLTGFYRVLAGRHFLSDTLAGAIAGAWVALLIARFHHRRTVS